MPVGLDFHWLPAGEMYPAGVTPEPAAGVEEVGLDAITPGRCGT